MTKHATVTVELSHINLNNWKLGIKIKNGSKSIYSTEKKVKRKHITEHIQKAISEVI